MSKYDYEKMSENARWLIVQVLGQDVNAWNLSHPAEVSISINGVEIEDLNPLFEEIMEVIDLNIKAKAADIVEAEFKKDLNRASNIMYAMEQALKETFVKTLGEKFHMSKEELSIALDDHMD